MKMSFNYNNPTVLVLTVTVRHKIHNYKIHLSISYLDIYIKKNSVSTNMTHQREPETQLDTAKIILTITEAKTYIDLDNDEDDDYDYDDDGINLFNLF